MSDAVAPRKGVTPKALADLPTAIHRVCTDLIETGQAVTVTEIATRVGISTAALYRRSEVREIIDAYRAPRTGSTEDAASGQASHTVGRPRINPDAAYDKARVTWIYAPGQLERLKSWAAKAGITNRKGLPVLDEAIRRAVDHGLKLPFDPEMVQAPDGRRVGQAPTEGSGKSPHTKWTPGPGQLGEIDARAAEHGLGRNATMRAVVEAALRDLEY